MLAAALLILVAPQTAGTTEEAPKDRVICKRRKATGTRMAKRVCMSVAEREARSERDRRIMLEAVGTPQLNPPEAGS